MCARHGYPMGRKKLAPVSELALTRLRFLSHTLVHRVAQALSTSGL